MMYIVIFWYTIWNDLIYTYYISIYVATPNREPPIKLHLNEAHRRWPGLCGYCSDRLLLQPRPSTGYHDPLVRGWLLRISRRIPREGTIEYLVGLRLTAGCAIIVPVETLWACACLCCSRCGGPWHVPPMSSWKGVEWRTPVYFMLIF